MSSKIHAILLKTSLFAYCLCFRLISLKHNLWMNSCSGANSQITRQSFPPAREKHTAPSRLKSDHTFNCMNTDKTIRSTRCDTLLNFSTFLCRSKWSTKVKVCLICSNGLRHSTAPVWLFNSLLKASDSVAVLVDVYLYVFPGYTVSSVIVGDWRRLYVAGAPRFKHKGKVILFELSDEGDVNIVQALNGEQVKLSSWVSPLPPVTFICLFIVAGSSRNLICQRLKQGLHLAAVSWTSMFLSVDWILLWQWGVWAGYRPGWHHWCPSGCSSNVPRLRKQGGWQSLHLHPQWGKAAVALIILLLMDYYAIIMRIHSIYQIIVRFPLQFS